MQIDKNDDTITFNIFELLFYCLGLFFIPFFSDALNYIIYNKMDNPYMTLISSFMMIIFSFYIGYKIHKNKIVFPKIFVNEVE